jgi:DNA polymerase
MDKRTEKLKNMYEAVLALKSSPLYVFRTENSYVPVVGEGSHYADIMFVGEAPGRNEAKTGRPFCGRAGDILNELLSAVGLRREEIYITSIVKDRPPENRDPTPEEITAYGPFLDQQIDIIQPKVIVTLGRYAMGYVMKKFGLEDSLLPISAMHGKVFTAEASYGPITIVPLYHPAVAIYNNKTKGTLVEDFLVLKQFI